MLTDNMMCRPIPPSSRFDKFCPAPVARVDGIMLYEKQISPCKFRHTEPQGRAPRPPPGDDPEQSYNGGIDTPISNFVYVLISTDAYIVQKICSAPVLPTLTDSSILVRTCLVWCELRSMSHFLLVARPAWTLTLKLIHFPRRGSNS